MNRFYFVTEKICVVSDVETESLSITLIKSSFQ